MLAGIALGLGLVGFVAAPATSVELKWTFILAGAYVSYNSWALGANRRMYIAVVSLAPAADRLGRAIPLGLLWLLYALLFGALFHA